MRFVSKKGLIVTVVVAALMVAATCSAALSAPADFVINGWPTPSWLELPPIDQVTGRSAPEGNLPVYWTDLTLTQEQVDEIRAMNLKAAMLNWDDVPFNKALDYGFMRALEELNIDLVAHTVFKFDPAKAAADVETVMALNPDIIVSGVLSTAQWPAILKPAIDEGVKIVLFTQGGLGLKTGPGEALASVVDYDPATMGYTVADAVHERYPDGAKVGMIWWNTDNPQVMGRQAGFRERLASYGNLPIIADMPMDDPNKAAEVANAMIARFPEVEVMYAPWDNPPAEGIVAALKAAGRTDIMITTLDMGVISAYEIMGDGQIFNSSGVATYEAGRTMAIAGAKAMLGGEAEASIPKYILIPVMPANKANFIEAWEYCHGPMIPFPEVALSR